MGKIIDRHLESFHKGWNNLVNSIESNTKAISLNSNNILTLDANIQNTEIEISKLFEKLLNLEKLSKNYFEDLETWTTQAHETIDQIRKSIPEVFAMKNYFSFDKYFNNFLSKKLKSLNLNQ